MRERVKDASRKADIVAVRAEIAAAKKEGGYPRTFMYGLFEHAERDGMKITVEDFYKKIADTMKEIGEPEIPTMDEFVKYMFDWRLERAARKTGQYAS